MTIKKQILTIKSPSRLHLGFYGMNNHHGYSYGSLGLAINYQPTIIAVSKSTDWSYNLPKRFVSPMSDYLKKNSIFQKFKINLISKPGSHVGLGSGTQITLSIIRAIDLLCKLGLSHEEISKLSKRGKRSGTGLGLFYKGGLVVDACKKENHYPKMLLNLSFPKDWRVIVLNDSEVVGKSGKPEEIFFKDVKKISDNMSYKLSSILFRGIIPSIIYQDFDLFTKNIQDFQKTTHKYYSSNQKSLFASEIIFKVIKYLSKNNVNGVGQSSWGPLSYIFTKSDDDAKKIINMIESKFNVYNNLSYEVVRVNNLGHNYKLT